MGIQTYNLTSDQFETLKTIVGIRKRGYAWDYIQVSSVDGGAALTFDTHEGDNAMCRECLNPCLDGIERIIKCLAMGLTLDQYKRWEGCLVVQDAEAWAEAHAWFEVLIPVNEPGYEGVYFPRNLMIGGPFPRHGRIPRLKRSLFWTYGF